jgi:hypothetical protein
VCGLQVEGKPSLEKSASLLEDKEDETVDIFSIQKVRGPTQAVPKYLFCSHVSADLGVMLVRLLNGRLVLSSHASFTTYLLSLTHVLLDALDIYFSIFFLQVAAFMSDDSEDERDPFYIVTTPARGKQPASTARSSNASTSSRKRPST